MPRIQFGIGHRRRFVGREAEIPAKCERIESSRTCFAIPSHARWLFVGSNSLVKLSPYLQIPVNLLLDPEQIPAFFQKSDELPHVGKRHDNVLPPDAALLNRDSPDCSPIFMNVVAIFWIAGKPGPEVGGPPILIVRGRHNSSVCQVWRRGQAALPALPL
jgi:hypothetical protein